MARSRATRGVRSGTAAGPDGQRNDWWRWGVVLAALIVLLTVFVVTDRRGPDEAQDIPPTTVGLDPPSSSQSGATVTESQLRVPPGLTGTLYLLGAADTLTEIDLATGRTRSASLEFDVDAAAVTQVVPLQQVVLIGTRRQVFVVDRATLAEQSRLADERWLVGAPDGTWAALVPFGAATGEIYLVDGAGRPSTRRVRLPSGVTVQGSIGTGSGAGLVVDGAGTLQAVALDGSPGPTLGSGRYLAAGRSAMARLVCAGLGCTVRVGTSAQPDRVTLEGVELAPTWELGPGAVFDPAGTRLALVTTAGSTGTAAKAVVRAVDVSGPVPQWVSSPLTPIAPAGTAALAFTPDGSTVVYPTRQGVAFWRPATTGTSQPRPTGTTTPTTTVPGATGTTGTTAPVPSAGAGVDELAIAGGVCAVAVSAQPPPPPPQPSGPPPSFA